MNINMPAKVRFILNRLKERGFEGYVVGGCVRDSLLGKEPKDWDITTDATPIEVMEIFPKVNPTGIQHGTVTVIVDGIILEGFEVTTYRIDGKSTDGRHPDEVTFSKSLKEDLSRRDFTVNAMAYNEEEGLIDYFGGQVDLERKLIKCVGKPYDRFQEDGLRILRAFRFQAQLGFIIDFETWMAIKRCLNNLSCVSKERIRDEFCKMVIANHRVIIDLLLSGAIDYILPGVSKMNGFNQNNPYHQYDLLTHSLTSMNYIENELHLKIAMLLHDIGKLKTKYTHSDGISHYMGHSEVSSRMAKDLLETLRFENKVRDKVVALIEFHSVRFKSSKDIKRVLNELGEDLTRDLFKVRWADIMAQKPEFVKNRIVKTIAMEKMMNQIIANKECYSLKQLAINGNDLIELGFSGHNIGMALDMLLDKVMGCNEWNDKDILLNMARQISK